MFIKMWQPITLYIDRIDWKVGHLTTTEGTGSGAFANKNCPQDRAFEQCFQMPGVCPGVCPGGGCSRLELTHTLIPVVEGLKPPVTITKALGCLANSVSRLDCM